MRGDGYGPMGRGERGWDGHDSWSHMHDGWGWGGWLLMILFFLLLAALVVGVVIALVRSSGSRSSQGAAAQTGGSVTAQQLLDERYARGEIDEVEYLHRRAVLRGS